MDKWDNPISDYWLKYYLDSKAGTCTLCGQSGIIHTEGIRDPRGIEVGRQNYCICPNGQLMRERDTRRLEWKREQKLS